ncbi:unnamed protein product [Amaranthus hypochondriacus]
MRPYVIFAVLSINGDTKLVMKGLSHGACHYLLKPVRLEELKNIWQHVFRRKTFDSRDRKGSNRLDQDSSDGNGSRSVTFNQDAKLCRKRKDQEQNMDEDDDHDENEHETEDVSQKKSRVVWSVELHRKFVAAVNQLGLDKAVPKKILELMNVEKLTRENVASHLQKYRLYLKRISSVANQQANMVAALGGRDASYLHMNSVNIHGFNSNARFQNIPLRSIPPPGVLARLDTPAGMGLNGIPPSGLVQLDQAQIATPSLTDFKFRPNLLARDHTKTVLMPISLEYDQLHKNNTVLSGSSDSILSLPNSSLTIQGRSAQDRQSLQGFGASSDAPPNSRDHNRCNSDWPAAVQSQPVPMNPVASITTQNSSLMSENTMQNMSCSIKQVWDSECLEGLVDSSIGNTHFAYDPRSPNEVSHRNNGFDSMGLPRSDFVTLQNDEVLWNNSGVDMAIKMKRGQIIEQGGRPMGSYTVGNDAGSLEDVVTAMCKHV